ncbi:hypothetical protein B0J12DRAFT_156620 [Macrophomina phaseolina]|uniref:Zn(2)-C6 fungal-type domain-containing protein n=1 Tax=Macrophomina phaseolina TaxID=35725 RepID=A0ABQ8G5L8_9PEZI|nr:hypothetical protein B0J12DRAFT_156620 [Macrophomina phaseolina]
MNSGSIWTDGQQSMRLSCDRCHGQKLRCVVSGPDQGCRRCAQAGAECIFSPKARMGRPPGACKTQNRASSGRAIRRGETQQQRRQRQRQQKQAADGFWEQTAPLSPLSFTESLGCNDVAVMPTLDLSSHSLLHEDTMDLSQELGSWEAMQPWASIPTPPNAESWPVPESSERLTGIVGEAPACNQDEDSGGRSCRPQDDSISSMREQAYGLAMELERGLEFLTSGTWTSQPQEQGGQTTTESSRFELYPIGTVLDLFQSLLDTLAKMRKHGSLSSGAAVAMGQERHHGVEDDVFSMSTAAFRRQRQAQRVVVDTATALVLLNCYVSAVRLFTLTFEQLQGYLASLPHAHPGTTSGCHGTASSSSSSSANHLRLHDLEPPQQDSTIKVHYVFRLLWDRLARMERLLGLPCGLRCSQPGPVAVNVEQPLVPVGLAMAAMKQEAQLWEGYSGGGLERLRRSITRVKEGLRSRLAL